MQQYSIFLVKVLLFIDLKELSQISQQHLSLQFGKLNTQILNLEYQQAIFEVCLFFDYFLSLFRLGQKIKHFQLVLTTNNHVIIEKLTKAKPFIQRFKDILFQIFVHLSLFLYMGLISQAFVGLVAMIFVLYVTGAFHIIDEGHIGVYKRGGAILNSWTEPGLHTMLPFVTSVYQVQVTLQTDNVKDIPCGTSSGVVITFERIEVVNRLKKELAHQTIKNYTISYDQTWIFKKIHHEINQFCSSHTLQEVVIDKFDTLDESLQNALQEGCKQWAPGIEIIAVRVTKPRVPSSISENYQNREVEKTKLLIAKEAQKLTQKQAETQKLVHKLKAQTQQNVAWVTNKKSLAQKQASKTMQEIQNQILTVRQQAKAQVIKYRKEKDVLINKLRLIPEYMLYTKFENLRNTNKTYYGQSIADYLKSSELFTDKQIQSVFGKKGNKKEESK